MDLNELNGPQKKILREGFLAAFSRGSLDMLLADINKPDLEQLVPPGGFDYEVFNLIQRTQKEGWTEELVRGAQDTSRNPKFNQVVISLDKLDQAVSSLSLFQIDPDKNVPEGEIAKNIEAKGRLLEKTVREKSGMEDFFLWAQAILLLGRKVCRIEDSSLPQKALGTGFLVAPDLVLTNYHVVQDRIDKKLDAGGLGCRFDYALELAGENFGSVTPAAPGKNWLVDFSRYSNFDPGDQGGLPQATEMDYAIIRLNNPVGDAASPTDAKRGWIKVSGQLPAMPDKNDIVFIVQHPKGGPLKLAFGEVLANNQNGTRIRYDANSAPGSSGSPCFDAKLNLVAIHHGGDPDSGKLAAYNQGIPIDKIVSCLSTRKDIPQFWV